jgi:type II secretory pathway component PulC
MAARSPLVLAWLAIATAACDRAAPAPEASPAPTSVKSADAGGGLAPAPSALAVGAQLDPTAEAAAERVDIDTLTPGVYIVSEAAAREILLALSTGAWTAERVPTGLQLHTAGSPRLATRLGLGDGDIVTKLGDAPVGADTTARSVYEALAQPEGSVVELLRDGTPRRLSYRIEDSARRRRPSARTRAEAILRVAITAGDAPTIQRAVLTALPSSAEHDGAVASELVLVALGLPSDPAVVAVDGASIDPVELAAALLERADKPSLTITADDQEVRVTIVPSTIESDDLRDALSSLSSPPRGRRSLLDPFGEPTTPAVPSEGGEAVEEDSATEGVTVVSPGRVELDGKVLETWMSDPASLAKAARIVPTQTDGATTGFKLYGIRRGSPLGALGFKNGDKIVELMGTELTSMEAALDAYTKLRRAKRIDVEFERKGAPMTLRIDID